MTQNNELYDHIMAARIVYQDTFENELDIIKELKIYLVDSGFSPSNINQTLYNFYQHINVPILLETIQQVHFNFDPTINNLIEIIYDISGTVNENNPDDSEDSNDDDVFNEIENDNNLNQNNVNNVNQISTNNFIGVLNALMINLNNNNLPIDNMIIHFNNSQPQNFENVVVTIDDDDFDKLNSEILLEDHESSCCICMSRMIKDEKITLLNCNHAFHYDCITPYLKEFNYTCPVCRSEVGKAKYNI